MLLKDRHTQGALKRLDQIGVQIGDRIGTHFAAHIGMHSPTLNRPGPHQRNLYHQVIELARLQARQQPHLGAALYLENTNGIRSTQLVVHALLLGRDRREIPPLTQRLINQIETVLHGRQDSEAQQIELDQPHPRAVIFIPLHHCALLFAGMLNRHHLTDRPLRQHHSARMDAQVPWKLHHLLGKIQHRVWDVVVDS